MTRPENEHEMQAASASAPPLPEVTHLQFLLLDLILLQKNGISATELRDALASCGQVYQGPKFYQLMRRLEDSAWSSRGRNSSR